MAAVLGAVSGHDTDESGRTGAVRRPPATAPVRGLRLGPVTADLDQAPVVMGILNRTVDSFYDRGAHFARDAFLRQAQRLVDDGADILDVGARSAAVGTRDVSAQEEIELAASSVVELRRRFDVPVSVDTWRAAVAAEAFACGAVIGNDVSGFADPGYLPAAAAAGASVVATHIRLAPQVPDPDPVYDDVVGDVTRALRGLVRRAMEAGLGRNQVVVDPGLDLGKTWQQSVALLAAVPQLWSLGQPILVAPSNKIFLGRLLGLERDERGIATTAACTVALLDGADVVRVHDARVGRQVADLVAAVRAARR
ncbi:MAG TPA: dihydropteroate synthase [Acidimicrobiales bacterium]|nr:dihydropteroate synthase [Acidimicrobiales bacterium]